MAACAAWAPVPESNRLDLAELQDLTHALTGDVPLPEGLVIFHGDSRAMSQNDQASS